MRNLGRFFGHIVAGARSNPERHVLSHEIEEQALPAPEGRVTLRRTTIEEIEIDRPTRTPGDRTP
jgi:hypothetical protein